MMTIMSGIAEFERELIRERCEEGIERAKRKGTKFGRPLALDAGQRRHVAERYAAGETMAELAREYECDGGGRPRVRPELLHGADSPRAAAEFSTRCVLLLV